MEEKSLDVTDMDNLKEKVNDVKIHGNPGHWVCLCKGSSESQGWMKTTKAANVEGGVVFQTETQQRNPNGSYALSQAVVFIPGAKVENLEYDFA